MNREKLRINVVRLLPVIVAIMGLYAWGFYMTILTSPPDQDSLVSAVFNGEFNTITITNGTIVQPGTEAQFIINFQDKALWNQIGGMYYIPNRPGFEIGPYGSVAPGQSINEHIIRYTVFTYSFLRPSPGGSPTSKSWFSTPNGNLSFSDAIYTSKYAGVQMFTPERLFDTAIIQMTGQGNYTLNFLNSDTVNATAMVALGVSDVTFFRPYLYPGLASLVLATWLTLTTAFIWPKSPLEREDSVALMDRRQAAES